jgi:ethanolamine utilization protein EutQ
MSVKHFTNKDPGKWYQYADRKIFLGSVLDKTNSNSMSVGFARYGKGESNEWIVTYDEVLIVTKGAFTVHSVEGAQTAKAGEVLWLTKGAKVVYQGEEDDTELVTVTYPHWEEATSKSNYANLLDSFHTTDQLPA